MSETLERIAKTPISMSLSCRDGTSSKWVSVAPADFGWLVDNLTAAFRFVEEQPCECEHEEPCDRCEVLNRFMDVPAKGEADG